MATAALRHRRDRRPNRHLSLLREYSDSYRQMFDATVLADAGFEAAQRLSDPDLGELKAHSGVVTLIAQHVLSTRRIAAPDVENRWRTF